MPETIPESNSNPYIKYIFFILVFIMSFSLMKNGPTELFGLGLFFAVNFLYCIFTSSDVLQLFSAESVASADQKWIGAVLLIVAVLSFVSSILLSLTLSKIQNLFVHKERIMKLGNSDTLNLNKAENSFIAITVFMWIMTLYTYRSREKLRKTMFVIGDTLLYSNEMHWIRILFTLATIGVGFALNVQLRREKIQSGSDPVAWCIPDSEAKTNEMSMAQFKEDTVLCFQYLCFYAVLRVLSPMFASNHSFLGYIDYLKIKDSASSKYNIFGIRWFTFYKILMYGCGLASLVYAAFSIRDIRSLTESDTIHECMKSSVHIYPLFVAFMFFLISLFTVNTLTAFQFTHILSGFMEYVVPPGALALSSYLVYLTNTMSHMAAQQIIE